MNEMEAVELSFPTYAYLEVRREEAVVLITMRREEKLNAMNRELMAELTDCFRIVNDLPDARAAVLTGAGKAFMAGADIGEYREADMGEFVAFQDKGREMYQIGRAHV